MSKMLHGILVTAMVTGLVFTGFAVQRGDNETIRHPPPPPPPASSSISPPPPSSSSPSDDRPDLRLILFGVTFTGYIMLKAWEITIRMKRFRFKLVVDRASLVSGCLSLFALIWLTTTVLLKFVALPAASFLLFFWILSMCGVLEKFYDWVYITMIKWQKAWAISSVRRKIKKADREFKKANGAYKEANSKLVSVKSKQEADDLVLEINRRELALDMARDSLVSLMAELDLTVLEWDNVLAEAAAEEDNDTPELPV